MSDDNITFMGDEIVYFKPSNTKSNVNCTVLKVVHKSGKMRLFRFATKPEPEFPLIPTIFKYFSGLSEFECWQAVDIAHENKELKKKITEMENNNNNE
jgi:hypothetical protein